jgi:hypothetical protein
VARRLVERERALADDAAYGPIVVQRTEELERRRRRRAAVRAFIFGIVVGIGALFALAFFTAQR